MSGRRGSYTTCSNHYCRRLSEASKVAPYDSQAARQTYSGVQSRYFALSYAALGYQGANATTIVLRYIRNPSNHINDHRTNTSAAPLPRRIIVA